MSRDYLDGWSAGRAQIQEKALEALAAATSETFSGSTDWVVFADAFAGVFGFPVESMRSLVYDAALKRTPIP